MSKPTITHLTDVVMVTVVAQRGHEEDILKAARNVGATAGAFSFHTKGVGVRERLGLLGLAVEVEMSVVYLLVSSEQQDIVVDHIYRAGNLATPGMGYVYTTPLEKVAAYIPESLRERLEKPKPSAG